jgi:2,4-dienoyl-CoA reductase-like NADH-dependent reductase (Old Yellow Enzyme family)
MASAQSQGKLFEPAAIGTLQLPNRLVRSATAECLSDDHGSPLPELTTLYCALAQGGVGLIITGHAFVDPGGRCHKGMSGIHDDGLVAAWSAVTAAVHQAGGKIALQVNHGGRQCDPTVVDGSLVAPSPIPLTADSPRPVELTERGIEDLIRAFADAAARAKAAGFDAVQIHGAHGYLVNSFNSPASNLRRDAWGGKLVRRVRFLEEISAAMRNGIGNDYPLFIKLGAVDFVRDGLTEQDGLEIIRHLADLGLDGVEISGGIGGQSSRAGILRREQEAYFLPIARKARYVTSLPIILVGGIRSHEVMEEILVEGSVDLIALSRPLIREPDLPNRLREGQAKATCVSCNRCWPRAGDVGVGCHYAADS